MATWTEYEDTGRTYWHAMREDGTEMRVAEYTEYGETLHDILVQAPDRLSEYFMGELEDHTAEDLRERAESVVLPDEDTGM